MIPVVGHLVVGGKLTKTSFKLVKCSEQIVELTEATGKTMIKVDLQKFASGSVKNKGKCFTEETEVEVKDGHRHISEIKVGDEVYSENPETGESGLKRVTNVYESETRTLRHIYIGEKKLNTTRKHPFYVEDKGWVEARALRKGDKLVLFSGESVVVDKVEDEVLKEPIKVYNLEVEDWHILCK